MFRSLSLNAALCAVSLFALGACGNSTGGGGGSSLVGLPAGSPCDPQYHNEGCLAGAAPVKKVKCVETNGTKAWADNGQCGAKQYCVEETDPNDASKVKKVAVCKDLPTQGGVDATVGDSGTATDTGAATTGDGGATTDAGPKKTPAEEYACIEKECPNEVAACMANQKCATLVSCAKACADKPCRDKCGAAVGEDQTVFGLLMAMTGCGTEKKCIIPEVTGPECGNGQCEAGESTASCAKDCPASGPKCDNGKCEEGETPSTCPADCKPDGPTCNNEKCEEGETYATCPADCPCKNNAECGTGKVCNDGVCKTQTATKCGNFTCESGETASGCPVDCDPEAIKAIACTKQKCASDWNKCQASDKCVDALLCMTKCKDEQCVIACATKDMSQVATLQSLQTCVDKNCGTTTTPSCGDGTCDSNESATSCPQDCKAGGSSCAGHADCQVKKGEKCDENSKSCVSNALAGSCVGQCGATTKQGSCYCDADCLKYGDCCKDWCAAP